MKHWYSLILLLIIPIGGRSTDFKELIINEIMVANIDRFVDPSWNYGAWIEFYNSGSVPLQLRGCWLSDDADCLQKVRITESTMVYGHHWKNLWFDHYSKYFPMQMDMKLDSDGGTLYLSDPEGKLLLSQEYPASIARASWARQSDGKGDWGWSDKPTPEAANKPESFCTKRLEAPEINIPSTLFEGRLDVDVTIPEGTALRYTTDGSTPTSEHGEISTSGHFSVIKTTVFRFALFQKGYLSSPVITRSYIKKDKDFSLPILSVSSDPKNFYSNEMGILVKGTNGRPGLGIDSPCNWIMDWDRPANFEFIDTEGNSLVNQETDILRCGGWSRANTPCSFKITARKVYEGKNTIDCRFFEDKPYNNYKTIQIRNGGNETYGRVIDAFLQKLILTSGMDIDAQAYLPVCHYINGQYCGVINVREPNNKHFVLANYGLDSDEIDQFEMDGDSGYVQKCGDRVAFERLYQLCKKASDEQVYEDIIKLLDIDEFCNYMAIQLYLGNGDWPHANSKAWRPRDEEGGRFRYVLFDIDRSFESDSPFQKLQNEQFWTFNYLYGEPVSNYHKEVETVTIFLNLLKNDRFRRRFIDAFCIVAGSVFDPARCDSLIPKWAKVIAPMQVLPDGGYGKNADPTGYAEKVRKHLGSRQDRMFTALKSYTPLQIGNVGSQRIRLHSDLPQARIFINDQQIPTNQLNGQVIPPIRLNALAPSGYRFLGWERKTPEEYSANQSQYIRRDDSWIYYDKSVLTDSPEWKTLGYGTSQWQICQTPFDRTTASGVCYFRKTVNLKESPTVGYLFSYFSEGTFILYVNGEEAYCQRQDIKMASDSVTLDASLFRKGVNIIAVEMHSNPDSKMHWEMELNQEEELFFSTENEVTLPDGDMEIIAHFTKDCQSQSPVVINEISAGNTVYVNDHFRKSDWVELYNHTDKEIDLKGMFLSDDLLEPHKYIISAGHSKANTLIPPHSFLVIWCDHQDPITQLHAPFKLANSDGACVVLTASDDSWADTLSYCAHGGYESVSRFPDGGDCVYHTTHATIGCTNKIGMYAKQWTEAGNIVSIPSIRPKAIHIEYHKDCLQIESDEETPATLILYVNNGICAMKRLIYLTKGITVIPISPLKEGIYIACVKDSKGNDYICKFYNN